MDITVDNVFPDGPSSNPTQPSKALIRSYFRQFETAVDAGLSNGGLIYDTKANMDADLAHDANASAWVIADSTVANNGIYRKSGASGSGSWTPSTAFRIRLRCGWTRASCSVIRPSSTRLCTSVWSVVRPWSEPPRSR